MEAWIALDQFPQVADAFKPLNVHSVFILLGRLPRFLDKLVVILAVKGCLSSLEKGRIRIVTEIESL